jgi:hypothetical protein
MMPDINSIFRTVQTVTREECAKDNAGVVPEQGYFGSRD